MQQAQFACNPTPSDPYTADGNDAESTQTQDIGALKLLIAKLGTLRENKLQEFAGTTDWREAVRLRQELSEIEAQVWRINPLLCIHLASSALRFAAELAHERRAIIPEKYAVACLEDA